MDTKIKNIFKAAQDVSLTEAERAHVLSTLQNFMKEHPSAHPQHSTPSPYTNVSLFLRVRYVVPVTLILSLVLGGGTAFAAEGALPGDTLYPMKIHLNEKVETLLAPTPEARAEVAAAQALRRVSEAETLAAHGRLDATTTEEIRQRFSLKSEELKRQVQKLEDDNDHAGADRVSVHFEQELDTHFNAFVGLDERSATATRPEITTIKDDIQQRIKHVSDERMKARARRIKDVQEKLNAGTDIHTQIRTTSDGEQKGDSVEQNGSDQGRKDGPTPESPEGGQENGPILPLPAQLGL